MQNIRPFPNARLPAKHTIKRRALQRLSVRFTGMGEDSHSGWKVVNSNSRFVVCGLWCQIYKRRKKEKEEEKVGLVDEESGLAAKSPN